MKRLIGVFAFTILSVMALSTRNILAAPYYSDGAPGLKVQAVFHQHFPRAEQVRWMQSGDEFIAKFSFQNKKIRAEFDKDGKLVSTFVSSDARNLPFQFQDLLYRKFPGYSPQGMTERISPQMHCYYILLKQQSGSRVNWVRVKIGENEKIRVVQRLQQTV